MTTHLNQTNSDHRQKLLLLRYFSPTTRTEEYSLRFDSVTFDEYNAFRCPFEESSKSFFRFVGSCNGLICLCDNETVILWNPCIRKFVNLPSPSIDHPNPVIGFGFNPQNTDFKVVRLACEREPGIASAPIVEIFSLASGCWRTISNGWDPSYGIVESFWSQVFLNGSVHWLGYKSPDYRNRFPNTVCSMYTADTMFRMLRCKSIPEDGFHNVILSLDLADEVFRMIEIPEHLACDFPLNLKLGKCGDSLALFAYDCRINCKVVEVSVMKEYSVVESWSKLCKVDVEGGMSTVFGFTNGGEMLQATRDNEIISSGPSSMPPKKLGILGVKGSLYAGAYVESLALLDEGLIGQVRSYDVAASRSDVEEEKELDEKSHEEALNLYYAKIATSLYGIVVGSRHVSWTVGSSSNVSSAELSSALRRYFCTH